MEGQISGDRSFWLTPLSRTRKNAGVYESGPCPPSGGKAHAVCVSMSWVVPRLRTIGAAWLTESRVVGVRLIFSIDQTSGP